MKVRIMMYNDSGDIISHILIKISVGRVFNVDGI